MTSVSYRAMVLSDPLSHRWLHLYSDSLSLNGNDMCMMKTKKIQRVQLNYTKLPRCLCFQSLLYCLVSHHAPMALWAVPHDHLYKEEHTWASFMDGFAHWAGITSKCLAAALHLFSWTTLKDSDKRKSSQWAEHQVIHLVVPFTWKGNGADV